MKALLISFLFTASVAWSMANVETIPTHGRNIYRLAVAELDGNPAAKEIVGSTYDNRVCAFAADGMHRWDAAVGGFVFDLAAGDLDGDGRDEIIAASADGSVYVFSSDGKLRWKQDLVAPVYQVAVAKLDGKTPVVLAGGVSRQIVVFSADGTKLHDQPVNGIVRILRAGDFHGDGTDEVAALLINGPSRQDLLFFKGPTLTQLPDKIAKAKKPGDPLMSVKNANGIVADLDGDGSAEFVWKPGAYSLKGGLHPSFMLPASLKELGYDSHYNMRLVTSGDLTDQPGAETVILEGPQLGLFDAKGKSLGHATMPFGFTDIVYSPGKPYGSILLGSSPNGDDNLYRLTFAPGWEESLARLERRGVMADIGANLAQLAADAATWHGDPGPRTDSPIDIVVSHYLWSGWDPRKLDRWMADVRDYEKRFPYPSLRFATAFWPGEKSALLRPDGQPWGRDRRLAHDLTREQIVDGAKRFEAAHCPFWVQVGHGCAPHLEVATVALMLKAAPTMLIGFVSAEDEDASILPYYLEHHIRPILELCLEHKKRVILRNKNIWWSRFPADAKVRELIFNGRYRSVILPSVEDSNSRSPDINLAARVGLWIDGQVDDWASRCGADWFSFNRGWEWEYPMTGHPHLRYYVSQAMLGARVFMMLNGEVEPSTGRWSRVGTEGTATFLHLLGRGAIIPPKREQLRSISPVALVMEKPSQRFTKHGLNGHREEQWAADGTDGKPWAFDRLDCYWGMAPLPPTDVSTYLWGRTRRDPSHLVTTTPHGFVALVPGITPRADGPWTTLWTTDGDHLSRNGKAFTLSEARTALTADLAAGAKTLPFAVTGRVFHQFIEVSPRRYIIALIDSGWLDPADRDVRLNAQIPGRWQVTDRITGKALGEIDQGLKLTVPAGMIRLLELHETAAAARP
ncbi:MAG: hypothetical protein IPK32_11785 [Verrucomicrobiaceae bacterium]|nr:hypothetical protein [Verrucomicrobiaceae bacterium]